MVDFSDDLVGRKFGNYRLTRVLGQGGFAKVYLGEHTRLPTKAAIKVLHPHLSREQIDTFLVEAHNSAPLRHPNIVRVLDFGEEDTIAYLVMDYAPSTLRQHHPRGTALPLSTIVSYVQQAAAALQYAHDEYRLIHRDVKPENMLVGSQGEILLSDFGIAQVYSTSRMSNEQPENLAGTVTYMAPEQFHGKAHFATDQYALGITAYEWLCGSPPFRGNIYVEVALQHELMVPPPLHEKIALDRPEIEQVVGKALAKKPELRFATIQAFAEALQEASISRPRSLSSHAKTHLLPGVTPDQDHAPASGIAPATPPRSISHLSSEPDADRHLPYKTCDDSHLSQSLRQKEMDGSWLSKSVVEEETRISPLRAAAATIDGSDDLGAHKGAQLQTNRSDALRPLKASLSYMNKKVFVGVLLCFIIVASGTYAASSLLRPSKPDHLVRPTPTANQVLISVQRDIPPPQPATSTATAQPAAPMAIVRPTPQIITIPAVIPTVIPPRSYEAEAPQNTLAGGAEILACSECSGGYRVGYIGYGLGSESQPLNGTLQFNDIYKSIGGNYTLSLYCSNASSSDLEGYISVNGGPAIVFTGPPTGSYTSFVTVDITVNLNAGNNTIKLYNSQADVPDIDRIVV